MSCYFSVLWFFAIEESSVLREIFVVLNLKLLAVYSIVHVAVS